VLLGMFLEIAGAKIGNPIAIPVRVPQLRNISASADLSPNPLRFLSG
jgi:hypothetical protein